MNWQWAVRIPRGLLPLFGGGMCLSAAFIKSGLAQSIVDYFTILNGVLIILIILIIALVVCFLTEVTSNTAISSVMMPILAVTALSLEVNPWILMMTAAVCSSFAFMSLVATTPNALAYSTEYVEMKDMVSAGWALNLLGVVVFTILLFMVVMWAFGFTLDLPDWALTNTIT